MADGARRRPATRRSCGSRCPLGQTEVRPYSRWAGGVEQLTVDPTTVGDCLAEHVDSFKADQPPHDAAAVLEWAAQFARLGTSLVRKPSHASNHVVPLRRLVLGNRRGGHLYSKLGSKK